MSTIQDQEGEFTKQSIWDLYYTLTFQSEFRHASVFSFLPILILDRHGLISDDIKGDENPRIRILELINTFEEKNPEYIGTLSTMGVESLDPFPKDLIAFVQTLNIREVRGTALANAYDFFLENMAISKGKNGKQFIQPRELSQLMIALANVQPFAKIYNPFAGVASIGALLPRNVSYFGQERDLETCSLGRLRLLLHGKGKQFDLKCEDSIESWNSKINKYDLIIANPPLNVRSTSIIKKGNYLYESFLLKNTIPSITSKGKLIMISSTSFLMSKRKEDQNLREELIQNNFLETIINFPSGIFSTTTIPINLLIFNKDRSDNNVVTFIDAVKYVEQVSRAVKKIKIEELVAFIQQIESGKLGVKGEYFAQVSNTSITRHNYNLNVGRYLLPEVEGIALAELLTNIPLKSSKEVYGRYVSIKNLTDDFLKGKTFFENILPDTFKTTNTVYELNQDALLISRLGEKLRVAYFEYQGESIFVSRNFILAFSIEKQKVDEEYLMHELLRDYALFQLKQYASSIRGTINVTFSSLKDVKIKLPSLEEQRAKILGIKEVSDKIAVLQKEKNALAHGLAVREFDEFASLKHTLATPRVRISSYMRRLIRNVENNPSNAFLQLNQEIKETLGEELIQIFKSIRKDAKFIGELLEKGETGLNLKEYELSNRPISDIIKHIKESKNRYNFELVVTSFDSKEAQNIFISANLTLLETLLQNIFTNAEKYAFDSDNKNKIVEVKLNILVDSILLTIKNNGKPFPKNYGKEQFIEKYSTADDKNGSGIGGYDINRIVEYFGGNWDLFLNEPSYPVRFEFQFPKKSKPIWI